MSNDINPNTIITAAVVNQTSLSLSTAQRPEQISQLRPSSQKNESQREIAQNQDYESRDNNKSNNNNADTCHKGSKNNDRSNNPSEFRHNINKRRRGRGRSANKQSTPIKTLLSEGCSVCKVIQEGVSPKYKCPKCRTSYCSVACCRKHKTVCPEKKGEPATTTKPKISDTFAINTSRNYPTINNADQSNHEESDCDSSSDEDSSLEEGWKITDDMKKALRNSNWLRNELQDSGLREMITSVVRSGKKFKKSQSKHHHRYHHRNQQQLKTNLRHPHDELAANREDNQNFDVFLDKLLVLGDVLERRQDEITIDGSRNHSIKGGTDAVLASSSTCSSSSHRNAEELEEWLKRKWVHGDRPLDLTLKTMRKLIPKFEPVDVSSSEEEEDEDRKDESKNLENENSDRSKWEINGNDDKNENEEDLEY